MAGEKKRFLWPARKTIVFFLGGEKHLILARAQNAAHQGQFRPFHQLNSSVVVHVCHPKEIYFLTFFEKKTQKIRKFTILLSFLPD